MGATIKELVEDVMFGRDLKHGDYAIIIDAPPSNKYKGVIVKVHGDMVLSLGQENYLWYFNNTNISGMFNTFKVKKLTPGSIIEIIVDK